MQMQRSGMSGCCVGAYYYDMGGAHSKYRAKDLDEFAIRMLDIGYNQINTAATNSMQTPERGFLEALGFKEVLVDKGMHLHVITGTELAKALEPYRAIKAQKIKAEQERQRKIALERQERERIRREETAKKIAELAANLGRYENTRDETRDGLRAFMTRINDNPEQRSPSARHFHTYAKAYYNLPENFPLYDPYWDFDYILGRINTRLTNLREEERARTEEQKKAEAREPEVAAKKVKTAKRSTGKTTVARRKKPSSLSGL